MANVEILGCCMARSGCEHERLAFFAQDYNAAHGTRYEYAGCVDKHDQSRKLPDLAFRCAGLPDLLVEHTSIVYPPNVGARHAREHSFAELVIHRLTSVTEHWVVGIQVPASVLQDATWTLRALSDLVSRSVARAIEAGQESGQAEEPFPWGFSVRRARGSERGRVAFAFHDEFVPLGETRVPEKEVLVRAFAGMTAALEQAAHEAARKFEGFSVLQRALALEFYAEDAIGDWIRSEDLAHLAREAVLPAAIDEVWGAYRDWIDDDRFELRWERLR